MLNRRISALSIVSIAALTITQALLTAAEVIPPAKLDPLSAALRNVQRRNRTALKSADVHGRYQSFDADGAVSRDDKFRIRFDQTHYLCELTPVTGHMAKRYDRVLGVGDRSGYCESTFSRRINPHGAHGDFYKFDRIQGRGNMPVWLHGPLIFSSVLTDDVFDKRKVDVKKLPDGRFHAEYKLNGSAIVELETDLKSGNNITLFRVDDSRGGQSLVNVSWKQTDKIWHVSQYEQKGWDDRATLVQWEKVTFSSVVINPKLSKTLFSLASLDLPDGARILDRRNGQTSAYNFDSDRFKRRADLAAELVQLPVRW